MRQEDKDRWTRGYLPHIHVSGATQFVTWRLADSLPVGFYEELKSRNPDDQRLVNRETEIALDRGFGSCLLKQPRLAKIVAEKIVESQSKFGLVHAFVVMPNHVHLLVTLSEDCNSSSYVKYVKGGTAHAINQAAERKGRLWQPDYLDKLIRDEEHFVRTAAYIEWNPVKAGLVGDPKEFPFSSGCDFYRKELESGRTESP